MRESLDMEVNLQMYENKMGEGEIPLLVKNKLDIKLSFSANPKLLLEIEVKQSGYL